MLGEGFGWSELLMGSELLVGGVLVEGFGMDYSMA